MSKHLKIYHQPSATLLAEGRSGWDITRFEGNYYIRRHCLKGGYFRLSPVPGLCFYKFIYLWMTVVLPDGQKAHGLAWKYVIPNPLFPFIWFRVGICGSHPDIRIVAE